MHDVEITAVTAAAAPAQAAMGLVLGRGHVGRAFFADVASLQTFRTGGTRAADSAGLLDVATRIAAIALSVSDIADEVPDAIGASTLSQQMTLTATAAQALAVAAAG